MKCEKCHSKMLEVPAKFAEMITEQFKVQCIYAEKGCKEAIPFKVRKVWKEFLTIHLHNINREKAYENIIQNCTCFSK